MPTAKQVNFITEQEYLDGEKISEVKHEYINGDVYTMAGTSKNHERISVNILSEFSHHLKNSPCEPFGSDVKVRVPTGNYRYPDCMVVCNDQTADDYYTETPTILVEVLSRSTRKIDERDKRIEYLNIPSLEEYILIEQDFVDIEVVRRKEGWRSQHYFLGDEFTLESIDLTLSVEELYHRVQNEDVLEYIEQQTQEHENKE
ncbi:MAG: hypothetical protein COB35_04605 [Gammaproteobacteria bacterium]|nr:MAG: hypothetical protein COB35_04605 [Gammaproteobacteria bacterium]